MKKEKFETLKQNNKIKWILGITFGILLIVSISLLKSHAGYILTTSVKVGTGTVDYSTSDAYLVGLYVPNSDNTGYDLIPNVPVGVYVINETESYCTTDGTNNKSSKVDYIKIIYHGGKVLIDNVVSKKTKCWVYLDKPTVAAPTGLANTIIAKSSTSNQIEVITHEFDGLTDYRYVGASPDNYICFGTNNKDTCLSNTNTYLYRIIGVIPTQTNVGGSYEYRVKLIKDTSYGLYRWTGQTTNGDTNYSSYSGLSSNYNNWEESRLNKVILNGKFLADLGEWEQKIGTAVWYLGGSYESNILTETMYENERGQNVYSGNPTESVAKVGLMYPSDYGYAASSTCSIDTTLWSYSEGCYSSDYLFKSIDEWLLIPRSYDTIHSFHVFNTGLVSHGGPVLSYLCTVRPSFYLKSNAILLIGSEGSGSESDPYLLS